MTAAIVGLGAMGGLQAATLTCGPCAAPVRIHANGVNQWFTDARNSPSGMPADIVDSFQADFWFDPDASCPHGIRGLGFAGLLGMRRQLT